jgi:peptidoglycan/LPS O-acetylase OafA/YrhL
MKFRNDIQILRGTAVLLVVIYHINPAILPSGFLGVDIFFVISGFLMAALYQKGSPKSLALDFYKRRFVRIIPAYFATVIGALLVGSLVFMPYEFGELRNLSISSFFLVPNFYLWSGEAYFDEFAFRPMLHLWSLGVEIQFYLMVPLFILAIKKGRFWFLAISLVSFISCIFVGHVSSKTAFFILPFRIWEFCVGFYVAHFYSVSGNIKIESKKTMWISVLLVLGVIGLTFIKIDFNSHPGFPALVVTLIVGLILTFGFPAQLIQSFLGKALVIFGQYSYSLYLVHFPVLYFAYHEAFGGDAIHPKMDLKFSLIIVLMLGLTYVLHNFVEKADWRGLTKNTYQLVVTVVLSFSVATASSVLLNVLMSDPYVRTVTSAPNDRSYWRCGKYYKLLSILDSSVKTCVLNPDTRNDLNNFLLFGDSHADAIKMSLANSAANHNSKLYFMIESCNLSKGECELERLVKVIVKNHIKAVVIAELYTNLSAEKLRDFSDKLVSLSIPLYYVDPIPVYPYSVPKFLYDTHSGKSVAENFQRDADFYTKLYKSTYDAIDASSAKRLPTLAYLCAPGCKLSEGAVSFYSDSHHLSLTGARLLEPMFDKYLFRHAPIHP